MQDNIEENFLEPEEASDKPSPKKSYSKNLRKRKLLQENEQHSKKTEGARTWIK